MPTRKEILFSLLIIVEVILTCLGNGCARRVPSSGHDVAPKRTEVTNNTSEQTSEPMEQETPTVSAPVPAVTPTISPASSRREVQPALESQRHEDEIVTMPEAEERRPEKEGKSGKNTDTASIVSPCEVLWRKAVTENSVESYSGFIKKCSASGRVLQAQRLIMDLKYKKAVKSGNEDDLTNFIDEFPNHPEKEKLIRKAEEICWKRAVEQETKEAYAAYIAEYGEYPGSARREAERGLRELEAVERALKQDTFSGYLEFLSGYPESKHILKIKLRTGTEYWKRRVERNPAAHNLHQLGQAHLYLMELAEAEECFRREYEKTDSWEAGLELGKVAFRRGKKEEAIAHLKATLEKNPQSHESLYYLGRCYADCDTKRAIDLFTRAIKQSPGFAAAYFHRGLCLQLYNRKEPARQDFMEVLRIGGDYSDMARSLLSKL